MLKEKNSPLSGTALNIVALKLVTGEEIIAKFVEMENGILKVKSPLSMVMAENPDNPTQTRVMFTPWMVAARVTTFEIREQFIVSLVEAREDAAIQYNQAVAV